MATCRHLLDPSAGVFDFFAEGCVGRVVYLGCVSRHIYGLLFFSRFSPHLKFFLDLLPLLYLHSIFWNPSELTQGLKIADFELPKTVFLQ